ncbi:transglycosylase SLT domain-containing protein [Basilea psittacipulmonis]|uniref:LysM domain-containing protein n=1 Tax=Basilea psittacipulmonis DSM 24701 TaxID=1072685 RepID=A0A077DDW0_9BURK|nr:transglycosylase SLT domain-containing protein [Basilea psittacipulmonis]AIL33055.1 hypothetical protein IX83_06800 [Basilea psittacipulmonis DSM 24701]
MRKIVRWLVIGSVCLLTACTSMKKSAYQDGLVRPHGTLNSQKVDKIYNNVWERIIDGFGIDSLNEDALIKHWVKYYTERPELMHRMLNRSAKFLHYVTIEVERRNMPTELALLPFVESAYNVRARSKAKAVGLWQFIPSTGRDYNLKQKWLLDKRRDPIESTTAALNYLEYLYEFQDKDWHLALASYNWGQGSVKRAIALNKDKGLPTGYEDLNIPAETRNYVPKLLALKHIILNAKRYHIQLPNIPDKPYFTQVTQERDMDVTVAAQLAEMDEEEFKELNPAFDAPVLLTSHSDTFLLPIDKVGIYQTNLDNYKGNWAKWQLYTPKKKESYDAIAKRHGIGLRQLKALNGISARQKVASAGRELLVPTKGAKGLKITEDMLRDVQVVSQPSFAKSSVKVSSKKKTSVKTAVARQKANKPTKSKKKTVASKSQSKTAKYVVARGDTLFSIAKRYNTTVSNLQNLNKLRGVAIRHGQQILVPTR